VPALGNPTADSSVAGGWEPEKTACKPKKLAVTEATLHLHWVSEPTVIEKMEEMGASFVIELWNVADGKRGSRKEVMPARPARPARPAGPRSTQIPFTPVQVKIVRRVNHHFFDDLLDNHQYQARVAIVTNDATFNDNGLLMAGKKGPWGPFSYPYKTKNERPPISSEVRRRMWANFYVDRGSFADGSLVENPCLGCLAQQASPLTRLSPLLSNVVAAHIIADAKGGPHGEHAKEAWNFMPLCRPCNDKMGTMNAVDWFYEKCKAIGDYMPLFEMLFRLWRGRHLNHELDQKFIPKELGGKGRVDVSRPCFTHQTHSLLAHLCPLHPGGRLRQRILPTRVQRVKGFRRPRRDRRQAVHAQR